MRGAYALDIEHIFDRGGLVSRGRAVYVRTRPLRGCAFYPAGVTAFRFSFPPCHLGGGRRGKITRFSPASRRRLRQSLLSRLSPSLVSERRVLWVTLTARSGDALGFKTAFRTAVKRLRRTFGDNFSVFWRLEYQRRGVPHLHLLLVAPSTAIAFSIARALVISWLSLMPAVPQAQVVKIVRDFSGISLYISDMGKVYQSDPGDDSPGRWWGIVNRSFLPIFVPLMVYGYSAYFQILRFFRSLRRARGRKYRKRWRGLGFKSEFVFFSPAQILSFLSSCFP